MSYRVTILRRARQDFHAIEAWLANRSRQGAASWVKRFDEALASLEENPLLQPVAPESEAFPEEIRHIMFRTRRGRTYRALFLVEGEEVRILRIRGAGQDNLSPGDLET
jgi:plasmid stabilization system protein ParE